MTTYSFRLLLKGDEVAVYEQLLETLAFGRPELQDEVETTIRIRYAESGNTPLTAEANISEKLKMGLDFLIEAELNKWSLADSKDLAQLSLLEEAAHREELLLMEERIYVIRRIQERLQGANVAMASWSSFS